MTNPFVFIVGCPRSGTTLLQRMMDAHPQVAVIPEIGWLASRYEKREGLTPEGLVAPALVDKLFEERTFGRYGALPVSREELRDLLACGHPISYAELISLLFDRYGAARGKDLVACKSAGLTPKVRTLHELWRRAKFIHLIRDGRDVCLSAIGWRKAEKLASRFPSWREDPVSTAAAWWEWHVQPALEAGRSLGPQLYYEVRYESLVVHAADELAGLCAFLGIPYENAMLRFHEDRAQREATADAKHAWLPPTPGLRDWRSQMPREDVERFEAVAGDLLDELAYPRGAGHLTEERLEYASRIRRSFEAAMQAASAEPAREAEQLAADASSRS